MAQQQIIDNFLAAILQLVQGNQALVNALQAAALTASAPAPLQPPPTIVQLAKALALASVNALLDYTTKKGVEIFNAGCASLPMKYNSRLRTSWLVVFV